MSSSWQQTNASAEGLKFVVQSDHMNKFDRCGFKEFIDHYLFYILLFKKHKVKKFKLWVMEFFIIQMLAKVLLVDSF